MIGKPFQSRIIGEKTIRVNTQGRKELKFLFESEEAIQDFLQTWDDEFHTNLRHHFTPDKIHWDNITFKELFTHLTIKFDCGADDGIVLTNCEVIKIVVKRKETHDTEKFTYELTVVKPPQVTEDEMISEYYYQHQEPNPENKDKLEFVFFETEIERTIKNTNE